MNAARGIGAPVAFGQSSDGWLLAGSVTIGLMGPCWNSALVVQRQARDALALARLAAKRYQEGSELLAQPLHASAERSYRLILAAVCGLTDADADLIEPAITDLENELYALAHWVTRTTYQD